MSIINQPTIYNTPTIYNAGGGGGYIPANINLYAKLKETVNARFLQTDLNQFPIKDTDIVQLIIDVNLNKANAGVYASILGMNTKPFTGVDQGKNLKCVSFGGTNNRMIFDKGGYASLNYNDTTDQYYLLTCKMAENTAVIDFNGQTQTATRATIINYDLALVQFWPQSDGGFSPQALFYLYGLKVTTNDGVIKYDFVPAEDTDQSKIGLFEKVNSIFIPGNGNSNFELIGAL
ncbi:MAG: hypothetical protein IIU66_05000 [Clostridia bacterium]|nr:hypothetical protein [Clostridia bacterium]